MFVFVRDEIDTKVVNGASIHLSCSHLTNLCVGAHARSLTRVCECSVYRGLGTLHVFPLVHPVFIAVKNGGDIGSRLVGDDAENRRHPIGDVEHTLIRRPYNAVVEKRGHHESWYTDPAFPEVVLAPAKRGVVATIVLAATIIRGINYEGFVEANGRVDSLDHLCICADARDV